jgi:DNA-binding winged helix-turn-helix (wHTH) protein/tetratricopeptide (TPR) repeat protein
VPRRKLVYLFEEYELDEGNFCLSRHGQRIPLEPKSLNVLLILVAGQGKLFKKDAILEAVWKKTFVEETTLTRAVALLRKQLGDDPRNPRFIETVPTLGYRFIAPVTIPPQMERNGAAASLKKQAAEPIGKPIPNPKEDPKEDPTEDPKKEPVPLDPNAVGVEADKQQPGKLRNRLALMWAIGIALAIIVAAVVVGSLRRPPAVLTEKDTVVLADFTNSTGDPVFDETLRQGMAVELEQSPFMSLVSEGRIQQTLRLMGQPADARLTPEIARQVCERTASAAVVDGSIANLGSRYVLGLRALSCGTGDVLAQEQVQAARKEDVLNALSDIASKFRARVGESLRTVQKHDAPLAEATTPSLEALKAYTAGGRVMFTRGAVASLPFLKRAIEIDPKFAMAYSVLGRAYGDIGEAELSAKNSTMAYELRDRASDEERYWISASYDKQVTGNLEKAAQTCDLWKQAYPRALGPHGFLSGNISLVRANYEQSADEAKIALGIDPDFPIGYSNLAIAYVALGKLGEAKNTLHRAAELQLEIPDFGTQRYMIAFLESDHAAMEREAGEARGKPVSEEWMANAEGFVLAYAGHLDEARKMSRQAEDLAHQSDRKETEALYETDAALREALFGDAAAARERAMAASALSNSRDVEHAVAFAMALSGSSSRTQMLTDDLEKRFPEDTKVRFVYAPTLRALLALNHKNPSQAVELLQTSIPYEQGISASGGSEVLLGAGSLYPAYVRGEAYLAMHRGREAVVEFEKILDHRGIVLGDPIGALAHLQLGRAYALAADTAKARTAYNDFLALWKDADPGIPILKQARSEYAKLQ